MNKMYEYLKNHAYISYNKKSTYEFELSEERAKCIVNKYDSLTDELQRENKYLERQCQKQKEVVLSEIENLQEENKKLTGAIQTYDILLKANTEENKQLKDNLNKLKKYIKETKLKEFEKSYGKRYSKTFAQAEIIVCNMILDKIQKLEQGSDSNVKD